MPKNKDVLKILAKQLAKNRQPYPVVFSKKSDPSENTLSKLASDARKLWQPIPALDTATNFPGYVTDTPFSSDRSTAKVILKPPYSIFAPTPRLPRSVSTNLPYVVSSFSDADPHLGRLSLGVAVGQIGNTVVHGVPVGSDGVRAEQARLTGGIYLPVATQTTSGAIPITSLPLRHRIRVQVKVQLPKGKGRDIGGGILAAPLGTTDLSYKLKGEPTYVLAELSLRLRSGTTTSDFSLPILSLNSPQAGLAQKDLSGPVTLNAEIISKGNELGIQVGAHVEAGITQPILLPRDAFAGIDLRAEPSRSSTLSYPINRIDTVWGPINRVINRARGTIEITSIEIEVEPLPQQWVVDPG